MDILLKISIIVFTIGVLILTFISQNSIAKEVNLSELIEKDLNKKIEFIAKINKITPIKDFSIITLNQSNKTFQGILDSTSLKISTEKDYLFIGKISEYNHTLQINIEEIKNVK